MVNGLIGFDQLDFVVEDVFANSKMFGKGALSANAKNPNGCPNWRTINAKCNNVNNAGWGVAGEYMPRSVSSSQSTSGAGSASVYDSGRWSAMGGPNSWGNHDPRMVSNAACRTGPDWNNDGGATVPDDVTRGDGVITYAQVMDHELDATGPDAYGSNASDSGTKYKFGQNEDGNVQGELERTHDSAKNGITSYVDAGILYGESAGERQKLRIGNQMRYTCLEQNNLTGACGYKSQYLPISVQICGRQSCDPTIFFMANPTKRGCFYAGDFRANENPALVAYHTLFLRMHNYYATSAGGIPCLTSYDGANPSTSSCTFETIRHKVGYEEQFITYDEWLPAYTGTWSSDRYYSKLASTGANGAVLEFANSGGTGGMIGYSVNGYQTAIRGSVRHIFATATFRQHTGVNHTMKLQNGGGLELDQTYFESCVWVGNTGPGCSSQSGQGAADTDLTKHGIQNLCDILAGQTTQVAKRGDTIMITEERNQLMYKAKNFGNNSEGNGTFEGFGGDLASLNIFRGRDHNIAGYGDAFNAYFGQAAPAVNAIHLYDGLIGGTSAIAPGSVDLSNAYTTTGGVNASSAVDVWVGALGEAKLANKAVDGSKVGISMLGAMLTFDVVTQFRDLRDGDRFFYGNTQLVNYGAPAWTGTPDLKGLNGWTNQLTGSVIVGTPFGLATAAGCWLVSGTTKNHEHDFFSARSKECGSGGHY